MPPSLLLVLDVALVGGRRVWGTMSGFDSTAAGAFRQVQPKGQSIPQIFSCGGSKRTAQLGWREATRQRSEAQCQQTKEYDTGKLRKKWASRTGWLTSPVPNCCALVRGDAGTLRTETEDIPLEEPVAVDSEIVEVFLSDGKSGNCYLQ
ncbi:MAG: hypothetical protein LQ338_003150 [Usnochroma carphineum]|nr:MAG: hypothetical protein LQ338_003150 [Usnochroma carphineum]